MTLFTIFKRRALIPWLMRVSIFAALTIAVMTSTSAQTQIGGIINSYYEVTTVVDCDSAVVITDPQGLSIGDKVLILQMKGATINEVNDSTYGDLISLEAAGCVEFMVVKDIRGTTVEFASKFVHRYQSKHVVQMIRVPVYSDAVVTSEITAKGWNGKVGGVIAFEVAGTLTLNANIKADSLGFRGGLQGGHLTACNSTHWSAPYNLDANGGAKGESVVNRDLLAARGKLLSGGGGGNGNNAGGGGGGNGGNGGRGGHASRCDILDVGGRGGAQLADQTLQLQRLFLGGGGGGAHENRPTFEATAGSSGGGLIIIRAKTIVPNGRAVTANGGNVSKIAGWDGAGGGGAGGTIYIETDQVAGTLLASARGGFGGSIGTPILSPRPRDIVYQSSGPGGGGGGGIIVIPKSSTNIATDVSPGLNGTHIEPKNDGYLKARGSTSGEPGVVINTFTWPNPKRFVLEAGGDSTICPVGVATLWAKPGFVSYRWSTGDTNRITTISAAGTYFVDAVDSIGCVHRVSNIEVVVDPTQFQMDSVADFGSSDLNIEYFRTIRYVNTDDEYAVISDITVPAPFRIVSPAFPAVLQPGASLDIVVSLIAVVEGELEETLRVSIQSPCQDSAFVVIRSKVNPVYVNFVVGSTTAHVGDIGVNVPITMQMLQDDTFLDNVTLRFDLTMDSRAFAPTTLTRGRRLRDVIDFVSNTHTITIELDSVNIRPTIEVLTVLEGTVLNSGLAEIPVQISNLTWVVSSRDPITTSVPGTITVIDGCAGDLRMVRFVEMPAARLHPNPASDNVTIDIEMTLRGEYIVSIFDVEGRRVFKYSDVHIENTNRIVPLKIPVEDWQSGSYVVVFNSPSKSQAFPLAVVK